MLFRSVEGEALREAFPDGGELFFPAGRDGVEAVCRESGMTVWGRGVSSSGTSVLTVLSAALPVSFLKSLETKTTTVAAASRKLKKSSISVSFWAKLII